MAVLASFTVAYLTNALPRLIPSWNEDWIRAETMFPKGVKTSFKPFTPTSVGMLQT